MAQELGEPPAEGSAGPCVVERIAGPRPEPIVLWTLDTLRRQLDATRPPLSAVDGEARDYGDDHIAIDRELAGRGMGFRA